MSEELTNAARETFYDRVFQTAARLYPTFLLESGRFEDQTYKRWAREAVRAAEFLVLELHQAQARSDPGAAR
jgi:hypothetical protein